MKQHTYYKNKNKIMKYYFICYSYQVNGLVKLNNDLISVHPLEWQIKNGEVKFKAPEHCRPRNFYPTRTLVSWNEITMEEYETFKQKQISKSINN